jgi:hypothetical protein
MVGANGGVRKAQVQVKKERMNTARIPKSERVKRGQKDAHRSLFTASSDGASNNRRRGELSQISNNKHVTSQQRGSSVLQIPSILLSRF